MTYQRDYERRIRVGLVGAGSHAYRNILPALNYLPIEITSVCDVDGTRAAATAAQHGAAHVFQDTRDMYRAGVVEAVILCVSHQMHAQLAVEAFESGLHVWVEKPPATRVAQVRAMLDARGDRVAVVGYKKAFQPATRKVIEILGQQGSKPLRSMLGVYPMSVPSDREAAFAQPDSSRWLLDGCHPLSLMLEVGGPVDAVTVVRGSRGGGACVLEFQSGAIGNLHLADGAPVSQPCERYSFFGESFRVDIENASLVRYQRGIPFDYERVTSFAPEGFEHGALVWEAQNGLSTLENKALFIQGIYGELSHFCECILEGHPATIGTLEAALAVTQVYETALESHGNRVEVRAHVEA